MAMSWGNVPGSGWGTGLASLLQRAEIVATTVPRTVIGWLQATRRPSDAWPPPAKRTPRQIGEIGVDEFFLSANALVRPVPSQDSLETTIHDIAFLAEALDRKRPIDLHPSPTPLVDPKIVEGWAIGSRVERLQFASECSLPSVLLTRVPWSDEPCNNVAHAIVLRHPGPPRPWVICVHGAGQGRTVDLISFRVRHLYRRLGLNVALPVLPLHGPRMVRGVYVPGFDLASNMAAVLQAVHDVRRLISWIQLQGATHIAVYGVSLGGYTASILAGVEPAVDTVIAGIPVTGLSKLLTHHLQRFGGTRGRSMCSLMQSDAVLALDRLVNPLALPVHPARDRRFIFAGLGDSVAAPAQAVELWEHWERPELHWYGGGHVSHIWSGGVRAFVDHALTELDPATTPSPRRTGRVAA